MKMGVDIEDADAYAERMLDALSNKGAPASPPFVTRDCPCRSWYQQCLGIKGNPRIRVMLWFCSRPSMPLLPGA